MKYRGLAAIVAVGCGGPTKHTSSPRAEDPERARIEAMRPASPYETRSVHGYTAATTCGQGPYRIEAAALGARYGEQLEVNICAPRSLEGDYRFTRGTEQGEPRHFGSLNNSDHCVPTAAELAHHGTAPSDAGATTSPPRGGTAGAPASAPAAAAPPTLAAVTGSVGETCPTGTYLTGILDYSMISASDGVPWSPGMPLVLDVWSTEPLDLDGAVFVVIQRGVRADMTVDAWKSYRDASDRYTDAWNAYLAGEVHAGRASYLDEKPRSADAPPPPRVESKPPRPSVHAEWIPGFWQREQTWLWSAGFWRVPEADIAAEQTIQAPVAPPAAKPETVAAPAASAALVWTPGYWAWNGSAYLWIEGAWRIPPQAGARWVAPSWAPRRGGVVLVPGGWSVRIGR